MCHLGAVSQLKINGHHDSAPNSLNEGFYRPDERLEQWLKGEMDVISISRTIDDEPEGSDFISRDELDDDQEQLGYQDHHVRC